MPSADQFLTHFASPRGFRQAFVREGLGGAPLLLLHGWPETKRIWWRNIAPLAKAGFEVIVPDLRGFGESDLPPDGFQDVPSHARDLHALVHHQLGHESVVVVGSDMGGAVLQELALRFPGFVSRIVIFNSPLPYDREAMAGLRTRGALESGDYYRRQGQDADALAAELRSEGERRRYIATFYTSRFWCHPGAFDSEAVDFMTEPFADAARLRASFKVYESVYDAAARSEPATYRAEKRIEVETLILYGPSDHVMPPDWDRMAAIVFPNHVGPFLVRDAGHFLQWEQPELLNGAVRGFCRDLL